MTPIQLLPASLKTRNPFLFFIAFLFVFTLCKSSISTEKDKQNKMLCLFPGEE
jgi:hypothetical protein